MGPTFQAHPIPQNVTNFEFHLVGDMTLKQFGYLATGLGIAFLFFMTLATPLPILAWPVIVISSLLGTAFAFLPIQERPLDHWVAAFFSAIFKPTKIQYNSKIISKDDPFFGKRLAAYLNTRRVAGERIIPVLPIQSNMPHKPSMADKLLDANKAQSLVEPLPPLDQAVRSSLSNRPQKEEPPKPEDLKKTVDLAKEAQSTQAKIFKIEQQLSQIKSVAAKPGADPKFYVEQFESFLTELQDLNKKASETAHELAVLSKGEAQAAPSASAPSASVPVSPMPIKAPLPVTAKSIPTLSLTTFPNIINGIVTDALGNYIEGAIIVAHDKQNLPVRALKSNKLGQFVAATPLPHGTYTIVTEKDSLVFDTVSIELKGEILKPVMISAKKAAIT